MEQSSPPSPDPSDEVLVTRVVQRDVVAFTMLFDRYASIIYALAAHLLERADAEEAVQEVFLRFWNKADQFDATRGSFNSWLMAIARHHVLNELRRRSQQQRFLAAEQIGHILAEAADPALDMAEAAWLHERRVAALRALQSLPAEQQQVLILAYFGGLSHTAIAQHLGWPLGTVKKRLRLGLQKLRVALVQQGATVEAPEDRRSAP